MNVAVTTLSEDILNKLWLTWLGDEHLRLGKLTQREQYFLARHAPYAMNGRKTNKAQRFEQWLFANGAEVRQKAGKFHLEFTDEALATMFALRYS
jgi:hypothetical protein